MDALNWTMEHWKDIGEVGLQVLGVASVIARLTPTEADNKALDAVLTVVHKLGLTKPQ